VDLVNRSNFVGGVALAHYCNLLLLKPRLAVNVPAMNVADQERTIRSLFRNVLWEIELGGVVILIVALLGITSPPMH
jgi:hypothetical protein